RREAGERHEIRFGRAWRKLLWRAWNAGKRIGALPRRARRPRKPPTPNPGAAMTRLKIAATLALLPLTAIAAAAAPQAPAFEAARLSEHVRILLSDAPLVFVGYGVKAPERNWDDFKGVDLKGKIMVVLVNDPDFEGGEGDFGGKAMTYYGRWTYKYEEGARQGAAGVLVIHETAPASYGWATAKNSNTNTMFDIVRQNPAEAHTAMEAWIQRDLARDIFKASGLDFD